LPKAGFAVPTTFPPPASNAFVKAAMTSVPAA
jgi:hypothetical protein